MTTFDHPSDLSTERSQDRTTAAPVPEDRTTRWAPAWVGAVVALPVFLVLQLLFIAFGWIALGVDGAGSGTAASLVSAVLAIVALFVGGLATGTASSRRAASFNTALQGAMTWGLTAVGLVGVGLLGGGAIIGNLGGLTGLVAATGPEQLQSNPGAALDAINSVQNAAGWGALWLGVAFVAAVAGAILGAAATKGSGTASAGGRGTQTGARR